MTFIRSRGSWFADGFAVGQWVRVHPESDSLLQVIVGLTDRVMVLAEDVPLPALPLIPLWRAVLALLLLLDHGS